MDPSMFINLVVRPPKATHDNKSGQTTQAAMGVMCTLKFFDVYN